MQTGDEYIEPLYQVVYCFRPAISAFAYEGIYSLETDAQAHVDRIKEALPRAIAGFMRLTHRELVDRLTAARLGPLAALLGLDIDRAHDIRNGVVSLHGRTSALPVAVGSIAPDVDGRLTDLCS